MTLDRRISERAFALHGKHPWLDKAAIFCAREMILVLVIVAVLSVRSASGVGILALVFGFAWGLSPLLERIINRPRPFIALNRKKLDHFWVPTPSFPSSHATLAFTLLPFIGQGPWSHLIGAAFALAALVAFARVYVGVHYVSDVIAGAVLGWVIGSYGPGLVMAIAAFVVT